jgi:hypothetical protein
MQRNGLDSLPWLRVPFENGAISFIAEAIIPATIGAALTWLLFHRA